MSLRITLKIQKNPPYPTFPAKCVFYAQSANPPFLQALSTKIAEYAQNADIISE
jgi:hypothetical protein